MKRMKTLKKTVNWRLVAGTLAALFLVGLFATAARGISRQYQISRLALDRQFMSHEAVQGGTAASGELMAIDFHAENIESLYGEISDRNAILKRLEGVRAYVDLSLTSDLDGIVELAESTPLTLEEAALLLGYCQKLEFKPSVALGLIELESNFKKYEVGTSQDRGYMQIIPGTEKWLAYRYGYRLGVSYDVSRIFEPEYNFALGLIYLNHLQRVHGNDYHKILSEYNRGPYNLKKYYNKHNTYQTSYSRLVLKKAEKYERFD